MNVTDPTAPKAIDSPRLLLGEGIEEVAFFRALLRHLGEDNGVQVEPYKGKANLRAYIRALPTRPGFHNLTALGITRDADEDPEAAAHSLRDAIAAASFPPELKVIPFVLPRPGQRGALETLVLATIEGKPLETCIDEFFTCAARATGTNYDRPSIRSKARVHAWLAAQNPPDLRLGHAAEKSGLIDWTSPAFDELKTFLRNLCA